MKHQVLNVGSVLACIVATSAGARTALAQAEPTLTPAPGEQTCPPDQTCPAPEPPPAPPAQPAMPPQQPQPQAQEEQTFMQRYGVALTAGGGVADWFDQDMRDVTGVSGTWEIRGYVGLNEPIGVEVAYVGRASSLDPFVGPDLDTNLIANGAEVAGRFNVFRDLPVQPYAIAGIGWTHFSVSDDNVNLADFGMNDSDDILQIPLGAGAAWRATSGLFVDARFTFRPTLSENLVVTQVPVVDGQPIVTGDFVDMDSWEASARLGYEF